jgi:PEP-CTERM motif-containing protein
MTATAAVRCAALVACVFTPLAVQADPIVPITGALHITSGVLSFNHGVDFSFAEGTVSGDGFTLTLNEVDGVTGGGFPVRVGPSRVDVSFQTGGSVLGTLEVNDSLLRMDFEHFGWLLNITAAPQLLPIGSDPVAGFAIEYPFQLTGSLFGSVNGTDYRYGLFGSGHASMFLARRGETDALSALASGFGFDDVAPVPEPTTFLLFATGAAAMGRRAWKRKSR